MSTAAKAAVSTRGSRKAKQQADFVVKLANFRRTANPDNFTEFREAAIALKAAARLADGYGENDRDNTAGAAISRAFGRKIATRCDAMNRLFFRERPNKFRERSNKKNKYGSRVKVNFDVDFFRDATVGRIWIHFTSPMKSWIIPGDLDFSTAFPKMACSNADVVADTIKAIRAESAALKDLADKLEEAKI